MPEPLLLALPSRFRLRGHLGSGGMGAVFEALDTQTGARVALKTLHAANPDALLYLKNEFRSLQDLVHPNLVNLLELIEDSGRFFVSMELVEGVEFLAWVRPGDSLRLPSGMSETRRVAPVVASQPASGAEPSSLPVALALSPESERRLRAALLQLAAALCALHESGKLHRDVKPANILVTAQGRVVLVDFGLAAELSPFGPQGAAHAVGTRAFMAPEQAAGQRVTAAADWFSVGVVLYLALTGELPFSGGNAERRRVRGNFLPVSVLAPNAPADLSALCHDLLELDPVRRPSGKRVLERLGASPSSAVLPRQPLFVGRAAELDALHAASVAGRDHAVTTFVVGDSGVGKSTLVREALSRLDPERVLVLSGRCYERELVPYKALDGIIDALSHFLLELEPLEIQALLPARAAILARLFPVLGRVPGFALSAAPESHDPLELRALAFAALRELFGALAEARPVLLFIDDLQWADHDSHVLLSDLLREPASPKIALVATARPPASGAPDRIRALAQRLHDVRRIELEPLSQGDALRLAESVVGSEQGTELAAAIAVESAGHPLFVLALAQHVSHGGSIAIGSIRLDDALFARVLGISAEGRRLLEFVAVAGAPLERAVLQQLAGGDQETFSGSAHALRIARLTRSTTDHADARIEPYHDRVRETVLARLGADTRRACHLRLAEVLESTDRAQRDPQVLVRHLEGAGLPERAAGHARLAAERALDALAFDQAAELYRTTLRLGSFEADERRALNLRLAEALTNAGRAAEAARAYLAGALGASPDTQLIQRRLAADHMLRSGHLEEGLQILSDVLVELDDELPSQRHALALRLWHRLRAVFRGLKWTERSESAVPAEQLRRIDAYHAVGVSLSLIDPIRGGSFEARALRLALDAGEPLRLGEVLIMEAGYRGAISPRGLRSARTLLAEAERIVKRTRDPYLAAAVPMIEGHLDVQAGEFARASRNLGPLAVQLRALPGTYFEQAFCHCFRLICLRNRGQLAELQAGFFDWVNEAERRGDRFTEASLRFNLNNIWLARDEPEEALRDLARVTWVKPRGGYHVQHWYEQHARAEVALYAADAPNGLLCFREVLAQLSRSFILRLRLQRSVANWLLGRLILAAAGSSPLPRAAQREVRGLVAKLRREEESFAHCWSHLLDAALAERLDRRPRARAALCEAIRAAEVADLPQCAASAKLRLAQLSEGSERRALSESAQRFFTEQQIENPARMLEVWAPGFAASQV